MGDLVTTLALIKSKAFLLGLFRSGDIKLPSILDRFYSRSLSLSLLSNLVSANIVLQSVWSWAK